MVVGVVVVTVPAWFLGDFMSWQLYGLPHGMHSGLLAKNYNFRFFCVERLKVFWSLMFVRHLGPPGITNAKICWTANCAFMCVCVCVCVSVIIVMINIPDSISCRQIVSKYNYTTFTLSWSFIENSSVEFAVCEGRTCKQCERYAVPNVWRFLFNYFLVRPNFKYSKRIFVCTQFKQLSCRLHVRQPSYSRFLLVNSMWTCCSFNTANGVLCCHCCTASVLMNIYM